MGKSGVFGIALALLLVAVVLVSPFAPALHGVFAGAAVTFTASELLGRPTDSSVTVNVVPSSNGEAYFEYGAASGVYIAQTGTVALTSGTPTVVLMQGLASNTRYYYRMVSSSDGITWVTESSEHSFMTQRTAGSTFNFTITSDSHVNIVLGNAATWTQTMTNVANDHPDFEVDCGDTFAMDSVTTAAGADSAYLYQRQFFDIPGSSAPVFLVVGNHEQQEAWHLTDTASPANSPPVMGVNSQRKYYLNPEPDGFYSGNTNPYSYISGDHLRQDYYAWTWGNALFVVIDPYWYTTTKPYVGNIGGGEPGPGSGNRWDWTLGLAQFNWLKQTLSDSHAKYKFVFAHHMVGGADDYGGRGGAVPANLVEWGGYNVDGVTWGWNANRNVALWGSEPIEQILMDNHVTAFFHGHDHEYAYEVRDGIVFQTLPAAGFSGYGFSSYSLGTYTLKVLPSPGDLRVTVSPSNVTVAYVFSDPGKADNGQVSYSYTILPNAGDNPPVAYNQSVSTVQNDAVAVNLSASDLDGDALSYQVVASPSHGSLTGAAPALTYSPNTGYLGSDSFTFKANDGFADSNIATVTVTVSAKTQSSLFSTVSPIQASYARGQPVTFIVNVFNHLDNSLGSTLTLTVTGPGNYDYFDFQTISVLAGAVGEYSFVWVVPDVAGTYVVSVGLAPAQLTAYDAVWLRVN